MRPLALVAVLALAACATQKTATGGEPVVEKQKLSNITYFDVASCAAPAPALPEKLNKESVFGAALFARPHVLECFTDPKNRGPAAETTANVKITIDDTGAHYEVTGNNLTPGGTDCVKAAMEKLPFKPLEKGAAAVTNEVPFVHGTNAPAVKLGLNSSSDIAGNLRLAAPQWCECWSALKDPPPSLVATVTQPSNQQPNFTFAASTGEGPALATCLTGKMKELKFPTFNTDLTITYPVLLINSLAPAESPDARSELQFIQLDAMRAAKAADVALRVSLRMNAVGVYDALVAKFNKTKDTKLVKDLKDKCAAMVKSDQAWIDALKAQHELEAHTAQVANGLKAKDPQWADAEAASQKTADSTAAEITKADGVKLADEKVCPKEHY